MKNYVSTVLSKINNKTQRKQIEAELQSHIQDRIDYYVNAGYDLETATQKANEHMGETAELVGEQLNSLMISSKLIRFIKIAFVLINLFVLYVFFSTLIFSFVFFAKEYTSVTTSYEMFPISSIYLIVCFAELFVGLKFKQSFLTVSTLYMFSIHAICMLGYMPFVFCIYEIVVGNGKELTNLLILYQWKCIGIIVYTLGIIFTLFCICISNFANALVFRFNNLMYNRKSIKFERIIKIAVFPIIAVIMFTFVFVNNSANLDVSLENFEGVYIIESDEMINPKNIENCSEYRLEVYSSLCDSVKVQSYCDTYDESYENPYYDENYEDYYNNRPIQNEDVVEFYQKYDELNQAVKYRTAIISADFHPSKKYVMVVPVLYNEHVNSNEDDGEYVDFSKGEWVETSTEKIIKFDENEYMFLNTFCKYEISIIPNKVK